MINRFCSLYHKPTDQLSIRHTVVTFEANGIHLTHPYTGKVYILSDQGDEFAGSLEQIERDFCLNGIVHFMMWADATRQLYVHFQKLGGDIYQEYEFSALRGSPMLELLQEAAFEMFTQARSSRVAIAMIIDGHGHTEEFDWDEFLLGKGCLVDLPDYLALSPKIAERLGDTIEAFGKQEDGFRIYLRDDWRLPMSSEWRM